MATVIDALTIDIMMDQAKLVAGEKQAEATLGRLSTAGQKTGRELAVAGEQSAAAFNKLRTEALALLTIFTAGRGLKEFVSDQVKAGAATGRLAHNLGMGVQSLSAWQTAVKTVGGSAEGIASSFQSIVSQFQTLQGRQNLGRLFGQMGVGFEDSSGHLENMTKLMMEMSAASQKMSPERFSAMTSAMGFDQGTTNLMELGPQKLGALLDELRRYAETPQQYGALSQMQADFAVLTAQSESFGRSILTDVEPALHGFLGWMTHLIDANQKWLQQDIDGAITSLVKGLEGANWKEIGTDIEDVATAAEGMAKSIGGMDWSSISAGLKGWIGDLVRAAHLLNEITGANPKAAANTPGAGAIATGTGNKLNAIASGGDAAGSWVFRNLTAPIERRFGIIRAATPADVDEARPLLNLIGQSEGTDKGRGYDETFGAGRYTGGPVNLTGMTLEQVAELQAKMLADPANKAHSSAVGRYQFVSGTLKNVAAELGMDPSTTKFTPQTQDLLATQLLIDEGARKYQAGKMPQSDFQHYLATQWASLPDPDTGKSYYGQGLGATGAQEHAALLAYAHSTVAAAHAVMAPPSKADRARDRDLAVTIHNLTVTTQATDPKAVAREVKKAISPNRLMAAQANTALQ